MTAMSELIEAVERGYGIDFVAAEILLGQDQAVLAVRAHRGSIDAALALVKELRPGWRVTDMHQKLDGSPFKRLGRWHVEMEAIVSGMWATAANADPARALLLALLRAMEADTGHALGDKP